MTKANLKVVVTEKWTKDSKGYKSPTIESLKDHIEYHEILMSRVDRNIIDLQSKAAPLSVMVDSTKDPDSNEKRLFDIERQLSDYERLRKQYGATIAHCKQIIKHWEIIYSYDDEIAMLVSDISERHESIHNE